MNTGPEELDFDAAFSFRNRFRHFAGWVPWSERAAPADPVTGEPVAKFPGVYILAHFAAPTRRPASHLDPELVYVGQAADLLCRLEQFDTAARDGCGAHAGGRLHFEKFGPAAMADLHVAAYPVVLVGDPVPNDTQAAGFCISVKRRLLLESVSYHSAMINLLNPIWPGRPA